jgi:hypothetical protein
MMRLFLFLTAILCSVPAAAQETVPQDAYRDPAAEELVRLARARRALVDTRITAYQTTAHERFSAHARAAGFERLVFRRETVARIDWSRDTVRVEVLGAREAQPLVSTAAQLPPPFIAGSVPALAFDPSDPETLLRMDSTFILHPLSAGSEAHYRFASGDSASIRLPDGRTVRLRELRVSARRADPRLIDGSFWLDAETSAVVRVAFRLSRAITANRSGVNLLLPEVRAELDHVAIEYGLWDFQWWLPRSIVARGLVSAAGVRLPLSYERSYQEYQVWGDAGAAVIQQGPGQDTPAPLCRPRIRGGVSVNVGGTTDPAARDSLWAEAWERNAARLAAGDTVSRDESGRPRCDRVFLVTRAEGVDLATSAVFEAGIYDDGVGPVSDPEVRALAALIRTIPGATWRTGRPTVQFLTPELVRYNRIEGLSLGARASVPLGLLEIGAEARAGTTGEIGARLSGRGSAGRFDLEVAGYRALEAMEITARPFSLAHSASALLLGRDDNDYFRGTGAEVRLAPGGPRAPGWEGRLFAERQAPVAARAGFSLRGALDDGWETRANHPADRLDQAGAILTLRGTAGTGPALRGRAELELHGETGDATFARPRLRLAADGLLWRRTGFQASLTGGLGLGELPAQRTWQIGGVGSVRGHDPATLRGEALWLARGEINRGSPALRLAVFGDAGWTGAAEAARRERPLLGAGVGIGILNDLVRLDLARGFADGGYRVYLRSAIVP